MKRLLLLACCAPLFSACDTGMIAPSVQEITLAPNERAQAGGLVLTFTRVVSDTRCPMGALCRPGYVSNAVIELALSRGATAPDAVVDVSLETTPTEARYAGYSVALTQLAPVRQPGSDIPPGDYRATVRITRTLP